MSRILKLVLAANLVVLALLVFVYPHLMIGPGKLIPGHKQLETDCFACHQPGFGSSAQRCSTCHLPETIGKVTTTGAPIIRAKAILPFHQDLTERNCTACHSDHAGVKRYRSQSGFDHSLLQTTVRDRCQACHQAPKDSLHQQFEGNCRQCHEQTRWVPATFVHEQFFVLDRDHNTRCVTCHGRNDYKAYTCYGCHEHTPANVRSEHVEEGISNFANCVECHRSADKRDIRGGSEGWREGASGGKSRQDKQRDREHDDD